MIKKICLLLLLNASVSFAQQSQKRTIQNAGSIQTVKLNGKAGGKRFDGIGVVNGGGATSVLLKDYPQPQRSQIMDLLYKPKFGASVSALLVEIPGDGNSTQGSMPSHMHRRDDLNYSRGYTWWILQEAKRRNPDLTLDGTAWSAPGWVGNGSFWSQDAADYYVKWLQGLRSVYGLELDAIGCRNEKGTSYDFAKMLRSTLNASGFQKVKLHGFDNWGNEKLGFVKDLLKDEQLRNSIDIISAHTFSEIEASTQDQQTAQQLGKPIWNSEDHVYKKGFDCLISMVECFNRNYIESGVTKITNWYDISGVYPLEPYAEDPATVLAQWPWSGHYEVRDALWGYAHYGQFSKVGWQYLNGGCNKLKEGGTMVTLKSPENDYSVIIETKGAKRAQQLSFEVGGGLSKKTLCVWVSNEKQSFYRDADIKPVHGKFTVTLAPNAVYSISTTRGQQKGAFAAVPAAKPFPFPYYETFEQYTSPKQWGYLPHYTADIIDAFEITERPDNKGKCLQQAVPGATNSWAPDWKPYTILGDAGWENYEISADIYLNPGDTAGVMGRVNHVGTGYGIIPKGYYLELDENGLCRLVLTRGKKDKKALTGDAEQQALIKKQNDESEGGEKVLGEIKLSGISHRQWHQLKLRFSGSDISASVDGNQVIKVTDVTYTHGMAGLIAGGGKKLSTPYYDNLLINELSGSVPKPTLPVEGIQPLYKSAK